ncbi:MAG: ATP-binding protein [bacterium]
MIPRILQSKIKQRLFKGKAIILYGPRQAGKTTLVKNLLSDLKLSSIVFDGDEADIREVLTNTTSTKLKSLVGKNRIVFIDEAQRIPGIGLTMKLFTDKLSDVQLIASGSSAFQLASQSSEALTGRKYEFVLYPLSFGELAGAQSILEEKRVLDHRLIFGSYPEIATHPGEERELLKLLVQSYLYKDVLSYERLSKPAVLEKLVRALALQVGSEVSYRELGQLIGIDNETVERYIDMLEKCYVLFRLPSYSRNVRNEIKKGKKIYFFDTGVRNAILGHYSMLHSRSDTGALWENYLIVERMKTLAYRGSDARSFFWRTAQQQEIDYVEEEEGRLRAFEFKWNRKAKPKVPKTFTSSYPGSATSLVTPETYDSFLTGD